MLGTSQTNSPTPSAVAQNLWHGSVETSTDTLVPIEQYTLTSDSIKSSAPITSTTPTTNGHDNVHCDDVDDNVNSNLDLNNQKLHKPNSDFRNVIIPEVHGVKPKSWTGSNQISMDESILMQPEHQRMEILNNGRQENTNTTSSYRRRRNSSNSRQDTSPNKLVNGR